jgi:hypothetical protein
MGGTRDKSINYPSNLVALCSACHAWVESNRDAAYMTGWLVHREHSPADVWLVDLYRNRFRLDDDGGYLHS